MRVNTPLAKLPLTGLSAIELKLNASPVCALVIRTTAPLSSALSMSLKLTAGATCRAGPFSVKVNAVVGMMATGASLPDVMGTVTTDAVEFKSD